MSVATSVNIMFCFSTETLNELERIILIGFFFSLEFVSFVLFSNFFFFFAILTSPNSSLKVRVDYDCDIY